MSLKHWQRRLREYGKAFKRRVSVYRAVARHPRTPRMSKALLGAALAYALMPFDLIPDWIPVLGLLDDLVILPLLVWLALRSVPGDVYAECEAQVQREELESGGGSMSRRMVEIEIGGMSCRRCAEVVSTALKQVPGVVKATVDLDTGWALITINDYVREDDLLRAVKDAGYTGRVAQMA